MAQTRKLRVRTRILNNNLRSIEGIWLRTKEAHAAVIAETQDTTLWRDMMLAAIFVLPTSIGWIFYNSLLLGAGAAVAIYLVVDHAIPAAVRGDLNVEKVRSVLRDIRSLIRSRTVRA